MSETCCTQLTGNAGHKNRQKVAICAPSYNFVGLYLRNQGTYRQSEKNLLSSNISFRCPHNMMIFGLLAAEIDLVVWSTPANFNGFHVLAVLLHGSQVVSISQTLWRWTGRPSRWALAHILVSTDGSTFTGLGVSTWLASIGLCSPSILDVQWLDWWMIWKQPVFFKINQRFYHIWTPKNL